MYFFFFLHLYYYFRCDVAVVERGVESYIPTGDSRTVDVDEFDAQLSEAAARIQADQLWNVNDDGESDNHNVKKRTGHKNSIKNRMGKIIIRQVAQVCYVQAGSLEITCTWQS